MKKFTETKNKSIFVQPYKYEIFIFVLKYKKKMKILCKNSLFFSSAGPANFVSFVNALFFIFRTFANLVVALTRIRKQKNARLTDLSHRDLAAAGALYVSSNG